MKRDDQIGQLRLLLERLDAETTVDAGGLRLLPTNVYTDPALAEQEREELFLHHAQLVGMTGDLAAPGSYLTVDEIGPPVIAVRDGDGTFRAFVNSCRHRGAQLETERRGRREEFSCPFHGWRYNLLGALVDIPGRTRFGEVSCEGLGLIELPAEEHLGLLWIHPDPDGSLDVAALLGEELCEELAGWHLDTFRLQRELRWEVRSNWKLAMDSFGETHHFDTLHRDTLGHALYGAAQAYDEFGRHHRMILCLREIEKLRDLPEEEWDFSSAARVAYWIFPNVQLMPVREGVFVLRSYPDQEDPGRHVTRITFLVDPDVDPDDPRLDEFVAEFTRTIHDEDFAIAESQQRSADGGKLGHVVLGRNEVAIHHHHAAYREALGLEPLPLSPRLD